MFSGHDRADAQECYTTKPTHLTNSANMQPYIPLVDIGGLTTPNQANIMVPPQGADPIHNSILNGNFSVVQCQNGTLLIPTKQDVSDPSTVNVVHESSAAQYHHTVDGSIGNESSMVQYNSSIVNESSMVVSSIGNENSMTHSSMAQQYDTADKPFQCSQCDRSFSKLSYLRKHEKRHKTLLKVRTRVVAKKQTSRSAARKQQMPAKMKKSAPPTNAPKGALQIAPLSVPQNALHSAPTSALPLVALQIAPLSAPANALHSALISAPRSAPPVENNMSSDSTKQTRCYNNVEYHQKFICTVCDRMFVNKAVLIKHMLTTHVREVYQCSLCRRSFNVEGKLKKHIETHVEAKKATENTNTQEDIAKKVKLENVDEANSSIGGEMEGGNEPNVNTDAAQEDANNEQQSENLDIAVSIKQEPREYADVDVNMEVDAHAHEDKKTGADGLDGSSAFDRFYYETDSKSTESNDDVDDDDDSDYNGNDDDNDDDDDKTLECAECEVKFHTAKGYKAHIKRGHKNYPCTVCKEEFTRRHLRLKHMEKAHPDTVTTYRCDTCNLKCLSEKGLMMHRIRTHGIDNKYTCQECDEVFPKQREYQCHMANKHPSAKQIQCMVCRKYFNRIGLAAHRKVCTESIFDGTNYHCDQCNKTFKDLARLKMHKYTTHNKRFQCTQCDKAYGQKSQLESHMVYHGAEKKFMCDVCSKFFISQDRLRRHQKLHLPRERKHKCDQCDSAFYESKDLHSHFKSKHLGEGPKHLCNICGVAITTATNLRNHMRTHTGEKPHKCKVCGKAFAQWANLKRHLVTHTKEKPHKCEICDKGFPLRDGLKRHMVTHSGEKPYQCDVCEMSFNQRSNLRTHMLLHNPEKPHKCSKCDKAYNHKVCLVSHMKTHHGIDMTS